MTGEPDVDQPPEERPRRDDDRARAVAHPDLVLDAGDPASVEDEARGLPLPHLEVGLAFDGPLHGAAVAGAIALGARRADRRAARGVEDLELDRRAVGVAPHLPAERVDLTHQMALRGAADGGVARHLTDRVEVHREQQRPASHARGGQCRLAARVASADDDDVKELHPA